MAREPFGQFARRIVDNGELKEFLEALVEAGLKVETIQRTVSSIGPKFNTYSNVTVPSNLLAEEPLNTLDPEELHEMTQVNHVYATEAYARGRKVFVHQFGAYYEVKKGTIFADFPTAYFAISSAR